MEELMMGEHVARLREEQFTNHCLLKEKEEVAEHVMDYYEEYSNLNNTIF